MLQPYMVIGESFPMNHRFPFSNIIHGDSETQIVYVYLTPPKHNCQSPINFYIHKYIMKYPSFMKTLVR